MGPGRRDAEDDLLGGATGEPYSEGVVEGRALFDDPLTLGQLLGRTEGQAGRQDRHLVHRVGVLEEVGDERVSGLVRGEQAAMLRDEAEQLAQRHHEGCRSEVRIRCAGDRLGGHRGLEIAQLPRGGGVADLGPEGVARRGIGALGRRARHVLRQEARGEVHDAGGEGVGVGGGVGALAELAEGWTFGFGGVGATGRLDAAGAEPDRTGATALVGGVAISTDEPADDCDDTEAGGGPLAANSEVGLPTGAGGTVEAGVCAETCPEVAGLGSSLR